MTHSNIFNTTGNKIFFFDENRETLSLNQKPYNKYKYDYIFSDHENPMIISSTLNVFIYPLIEAEKNLVFMAIGQKNLGKSNFLFGTNQSMLLGYDSLFNYAFKALKEIMSKIKYDKILFELYKITNDKFIIDFKEITDLDKLSILENINKHIKKKEKMDNRGRTMEPLDTGVGVAHEAEGHIIVKIKFFQFLSNNDTSKSQRQIEIIRTFSFIDIKDDETSGNDMNSPSYSINCFKKMIQSITNCDLNQFTEISSNLTDILREIFSIPKLYTFIFGLIDENKGSIDKSLKTLNLLNICKNIDNDKFYAYLYQMNISISRIENKALKEEFQILDLLFGEIIYYLEKTFAKLDQFFYEVKDLELKEKFVYLKQWLIKNNYNFQKNQNFCLVLENILGYIRNRAQWMQLKKAKTIIMKLTEGLKNYQEDSKKNNISTNNNNTYRSINTHNNNAKYSISNKTNYYYQTDFSKNKISSLDSEEKIFKDLDNEIGNTKSEISKVNKRKYNSHKYNTILSQRQSLQQNQILNNSKNQNIIKPKSQDKINDKKDKSTSLGLSDMSFFDSKNKAKFDFPSRSIGEFPTDAKSIESSFTQKLYKGFKDNLRKLFTDLYLRFTTEEEGCFNCRNSMPMSKNYRLNMQRWVNEYKSLSQLQTVINMEQISMINSKNNKNNSSYYDKNEEIKIHFYEDEQSVQNRQKYKQRMDKINKRMKELKINNN